MSIDLSFHGAVGGVTGSCHLMEADGTRVLVDCGLFQGDNQWRSRNASGFGFDPSEIDFLLLTHAHLDHVGRLPLLVKRGFRGKVICTPATAEIARIILLDSARIQEEDVEHWRPVNLRAGFQPKAPLYGTPDAFEALGYFEPRADYGKSISLTDRLKVTFRDAGHILGSSFLEVAIKGGAKVLFSGDLGNRGKPIVRDPEYPSHADVAVLESTYGDRDHRSFEESSEELLKVVKDTFDAGGNVIIPSFAVERAQELLFVFARLWREGRLPECKVFLDTPMGINVTNIMRIHPECFDDSTLALIRAKDDPFNFPGLEFTRAQAASKRINHVRSGAIIIAGSGMCTGGRIRLHLQRNIMRPECSIVFIGFQAEGTLGREIVEGAQEVSILDEVFEVRAKVHTIGGFSSHAGQAGLMDWISHRSGLDKVFLVHGEPRAVEALGARLRSLKGIGEVLIPRLHETYTLD